MKKEIKLNKPSNKPLNANTPVFFNTPRIFDKKVNKLVFKPLQYVINDTGNIRHYPPAAQE
jgi:hypothetical protein